MTRKDTSKDRELFFKQHNKSSSKNARSHDMTKHQRITETQLE